MTREDWLVGQLDSGKLDAITSARYEQELDDIAQGHSKRQASEVAAKAVADQRRADIKAMLLAGNLDVIDTFGMEEFGPDYEVTMEGDVHVVYSKVARDDQENRHHLSSATDAQAKLRKLVWDRMYTKYVRSGEISHLSELSA